MSTSPLYPKFHRFQADEIREGDPYELSDGQLIQCLPTGGRGSDATRVGATVLSSDPAVESAGIDTGFSPKPDTLRAPDVAIGNVPKEPGWVKGVPPLAVEYADTGQNEADLATKIKELLAAGTQFIWVVRLTGPRRVDIYEQGTEMRVAHPGEELRAPGILKNPVQVEALYDWEIGQGVTLRNLLQRQGYDDLDAVREEREVETLRDSIVDIFETRGLQVDDDAHQVISICADSALLKRWLRLAVTAGSAAELLDSV